MLSINFLKPLKTLRYVLLRKTLRESGAFIVLFLVSHLSVSAQSLHTALPECFLVRENVSKGQAGKGILSTPVMFKEVEIKIQIEHAQLDTLKAWLSGHAEFKNELSHTEWYLDNPQDTYFFTAPEGYKDALRYLRVRSTERGDSVAYKNWHRDSQTGKTTYCDEYETKVESAAAMLALFSQIGFTEQTKVAKHRATYATTDFEIVIDNIENLGYFVEIEVLRPKENVQESLADINAFLKNVGITRFRKQERGYVNMIWNPGYDFGVFICI